MTCTEQSTAPDWTIETRSAEETRALGRKIASQLKGGEVILLRGELGAGKTCLAGGIAEGLGIEEPAVSPTFVLVRSYETPRGLTLHHMDFYRFESAEEADAIGAEEYVTPDSVVLVEWPERCPGVFSDFSLRVELASAGADSRSIRFYHGSLPVDMAYVNCLS